MLYRRSLLALWLACLTLVAQAPQQDAQRIERLVGLGKLWGRVRLLNPDLATKPIDWDKALVEAIRSVNDAKDKEDFTKAVATMLNALGDPTSGLAEPKLPSLVELPEGLSPCTWLDEQTLLLHLNDLLRFQKGVADGAEFNAMLRRESAKARRIIFDLRPEKSVNGMDDSDRGYPFLLLQTVLDGLVPTYLTQPLQLPSKRMRIHRGYRGEGAKDLYYSGLLLQAGLVLQPSSKGSRKDLAFLINDRTLLPLHVMALHKAGLALLVMEGNQSRNWAAQTSPFSLPGGLTGQLKTADWLFEDGSTECVPDATAPTSNRIDAETPGVQTILHRWEHPQFNAGKTNATRPMVPRFQPDEPYPNQLFPEREYRALAAIKFWTTIDQLYPYKNLLDRPWGTMLPEFLDLMDRAKDVQEYQLSVASMVAQIQDSHGSIENALRDHSERPGQPDALKDYFGTGRLPVALAVIEGRPVVLRTWGDAATRFGFQPGDEILSVSGEPAKSRMDRFRPYIAASTPHRLDWFTVGNLLRGPLGETGVVEIRRANGTRESLSVVWSTEGPPAAGKWRTGPEFQILPGDIGYVDLDRISPGQVSSMFETIRHTHSLILDMRGYPTFGAWRTVGSFLKHPKAPGYQVQTPLILGEGDDDGLLSAAEVGSIPYAQPALYKGRVVMLMDERSQSAAEHMGLLLEAGAEVTFIGSPTSGANGDVTPIVLPGALRVFFTGASISHADGKQLQRVGLRPHISVRPTAEGLADGRDEVLERAIRFVKEGH